MRTVKIHLITNLDHGGVNEAHILSELHCALLAASCCKEHTWRGIGMSIMLFLERIKEAAGAPIGRKDRIAAATIADGVIKGIMELHPDIVGCLYIVGAMLQILATIDPGKMSTSVNDFVTSERTVN